jgi:DNA-binding NarL/FixJ family response regulator
MVEAVRAGALGWLGKDASMAETLAAVRAVARGEGWLAPADLGVLLRALTDSGGSPRAAGAPGDPLAVLSRQERRVLAELVNGAPGPEIASTLRVSVGTVRSHLHSVFGKLGVHSRLEAVRVARAAGMRPDR